ncbi:MAG: undecaprenyl-phosphate alpha-N-acetylglucosaminyl 1-phosphate transferase [Glaciihabitans sp.]|nr:undecaprenyl-phosphate alpha-N-acetylglucosaminyl 1-phosphate transferase [Glaciihabitans sp.]
MRIIFYVLTTGVAAAVTYVLARLIVPLAHRYKLYPKVRSRDVHTQPVPRLGGVAMFLGIIVAIGVASQLPQLSLAFSEPTKIWGILGAATIIFVLGVADDVWDLDWVTKLAGQIIAGGVLAWGGVQVVAIPAGSVITMLSPLTSLIITVLTVVLVMNAVNFIDGLDGLVAGVAIIATGVFFIYSYLLQSQAQIEYFNLASLITSVLIGACLGFLPLNFHPAKLFMGDAGALLVGLLMATAAITVTGQIDIEGIGRSDVLPAFIPVLLPVAILVVPLLDFGLAVMRRLRAGKSPFSADRKHLHHRLLDMGHTHLHAVLIFYGWTAVVAVGCLLFMFVPWYWALGFIFAGLVIATAFTLAPLSRRKRAEAAAQLDEPVDGGVVPDARFDQLDAASESVDPDNPGVELAREVLP